MIIDLEIASVMGMRRDRFMDLDIDMAMFISLIGLKNMTKLVQALSNIASKLVQHGAKIGSRTDCSA